MFKVFIAMVWLVSMFTSPVFAQCDGKDTFTAQDAQDAFDKYMKTCTSCEDICCDVNEDGKCTPADVRCIARRAAGESSCLDAPAFTSGTITGHVRGNGLPIAGASLEVGSVSGTTDDMGDFAIQVTGAEITDTLDGEMFLIKVTAGGFATGYAKAARSDVENDFDIEIKLLEITDEITQEEDVSTGVDIVAYGAKVGELTIPSEAFPEGVTQITGDVTYLDPTTTEIDAAPGGDFRAVPKTADPDQPVISLNSFAMMNFDLKDQNGNPISQLAGQATICMKVPDGIDVSVGDKIPLWWYNPEDGLWHEEGESTVESWEGTFWMCGSVSHFSSWNCDEPLREHSCFRFTFRDEELRPAYPVAGLKWWAEGVSYRGTSPQRNCRTCRRCRSVPPSSFTVKRNERIRVYTRIKGNRYYLVDDGDGTFSVNTDKSKTVIISTPTVQASCYRGYNIGGCRNLDDTNGNGRDSAGASADGILPFRKENAINRAPDIRAMFADPKVNVGETLGNSQNPLYVTLKDPEGDTFSVTWSSTCGDIYSFQPRTADPVYPGYFRESPMVPSAGPAGFCRITATSQDSKGNKTEAFVRVQVGDDIGKTFTGLFTYLNSEGIRVPLKQGTEIRMSSSSGYDSRVSADMNGRCVFEGLPCECNSSTYTFGFSFEELTFPSTVRHTVSADISCCGVTEQIDFP